MRLMEKKEIFTILRDTFKHKHNLEAFISQTIPVLLLLFFSNGIF